MYKGGIFQLRLTITFLVVIMNIVMMVILSPWPDKRFQGGFYSFYLEIIIIWLRKSVFFTIIIMKIMNHKWCKLLLFNFDDDENIYQRLLQLQIHITYCSRLNLTLNIVDFSAALFRLRILSNLMSSGRQRCQQYLGHTGYQLQTSNLKIRFRIMGFFSKIRPHETGFIISNEIVW